MVTALLIGFILKRPVLQVLGVVQPDSLESLSIPMQQISRVVVENKDSLSKEEKELINSVADLDRIAEEYNPIIHDPIKALVRFEGDKDAITNNKINYIKLYLALGIKYPSAYLRAWVDQTKGYWNGGYSYWKWSDEVSTNEYGIER